VNDLWLLYAIGRVCDFRAPFVSVNWNLPAAISRNIHCMVQGLPRRSPLLGSRRLGVHVREVSLGWHNGLCFVARSRSLELACLTWSQFSFVLSVCFDGLHVCLEKYLYWGKSVEPGSLGWEGMGQGDNARIVGEKGCLRWNDKGKRFVGNSERETRWFWLDTPEEEKESHWNVGETNIREHPCGGPNVG